MRVRLRPSEQEIAASEMGSNGQIALRNSCVTNGSDGHKGQARDAAASFGGHFVVRTENITPLDGVAPKRFLLIAFDTIEKAKAWDASAAMKEVNEVRIQTTKSRSFIVDEM